MFGLPKTLLYLIGIGSLFLASPGLADESLDGCFSSYDLAVSSLERKVSRGEHAPADMLGVSSSGPIMAGGTTAIPVVSSGSPYGVLLPFTTFAYPSVATENLAKGSASDSTTSFHYRSLIDEIEPVRYLLFVLTDPEAEEEGGLVRLLEKTNALRHEKKRPPLEEDVVRAYLVEANARQTFCAIAGVDGDVRVRPMTGGKLVLWSYSKIVEWLVGL